MAEVGGEKGGAICTTFWRAAASRAIGSATCSPCAHSGSGPAAGLPQGRRRDGSRASRVWGSERVSHAPPKATASCYADQNRFRSIGSALVPSRSPSEAGIGRSASNYLMHLVNFGAGEGIRTLDPNLGKVVLYP